MRARIAHARYAVRDHHLEIRKTFFHGVKRVGKVFPKSGHQNLTARVNDFGVFGILIFLPIFAMRLSEIKTDIPARGFSLRISIKVTLRKTSGRFDAADLSCAISSIGKSSLPIAQAIFS